MGAIASYILPSNPFSIRQLGKRNHTLLQLKRFVVSHLSCSQIKFYYGISIYGYAAWYGAHKKEPWVS